MTFWAEALEATPLAAYLKRSAWIYPLVNAGHILGIALLVGAIVPMNLRLLGVVRAPGTAETVALLRPFAAAGLALAILCGLLLFATQATDYVANPWFRGKMALVAAGILSVIVHYRLTHPARAAAISLAVWPAAILAGRMIGYS